VYVNTELKNAYVTYVKHCTVKYHSQGCINPGAKRHGEYFNITNVKYSTMIGRKNKNESHINKGTAT